MVRAAARLGQGEIEGADDVVDPVQREAEGAGAEAVRFQARPISTISRSTVATIISWLPIGSRKPRPAP